MKNFSNSFKWIIFCLLLLFITGVTWAIRSKVSLKPQPIKTRLVVNKPVVRSIDTALLLKLEFVLKGMDMQIPSFTCEGVINMENKADSSDKLDHAPFVICRENNELYYKLDKIVSINGKGAFVEINAATHRVFLEKEKKINVLGIPDAVKLKEAIQNEGYVLKSSRKGAEQIISIINEESNYYKEYAFTFDTLTMKLNQLYARIADRAEPANAQKVKTIAISFSKFEKAAEPQKYVTIADVLDKRKKLTPGYKDYQLTVLQ